MAKQMVFGYNFGKLSIAVVEAGEKAEREDWRELDPSSLPKDIEAQYNAYVELRREANSAKQLFENALRVKLGFEQKARANKAGSKAISFMTLARQS